MEYEEALCRVSEALRAHNKVKGGISSREACELILEAVSPVMSEEMKPRFRYGILSHPIFGRNEVYYDEAREVYIFDSITRELVVKYGWTFDEIKEGAE